MKNIESETVMARPLASGGPPNRDGPSLRPTIVLVALALTCAAGVFIAPPRELVAGFAIAMMLMLTALKVPVALSLTVPGLLGIYSLAGAAALENVMRSGPFSATAQWSLSVIPMFVLMGLLLWSSGLTGKIYVAARHWIGWLPGGLGMGTNGAGAALAAVSGSTIGTTYALARAGIPEMLRAGYDKRLALASVIVAGLPGQLIPPSIFLVIVAGLLEVPVGSQLMAGVIPGLLVAALCGLTIMVIALVRPSWAGRDRVTNEPRSTWGMRFRSLVDIWPVPAIILAVFGGMFTGVLTATEAGALGALGAAVTCLVARRKQQPIKRLFEASVMATAGVGAIFLMIIGAHILANLLAISGLGRLFASTIIDLGFNRVVILVVLMLIYVFLGMFMDPLAMLLLTIPVLMPVLVELDISLLWFGVFAVFMSELAILTPPVGVLSFILHGIVQDRAVNLGHDISLGDVFRSVALVLPVAILFALILIAVPELATWLPSQFAVK